MPALSPTSRSSADAFKRRDLCGVAAGRVSKHGSQPRSPLVQVDLGHRRRQSVEAGLPVEVEQAAATGGALGITFPTGMKFLPRWASRLDLEQVKLPAFAASKLRADLPDLREVEIGGTTIERVRALADCRVTVPDPAHVSPVSVKWLGDHHRTLRRGPPDNHAFSARPLAADKHLVGNGEARFGEAAHSTEKIVCRHIVCTTDAEFSSDEEVAGAARLSPRFTPQRRQVELEAFKARRRFETTESVQKAHPFTTEPRFGDIVSRSPHSTLVGRDAFGSWLRGQLAAMAPPERKSFLLNTPVHVMNIVLTATSRADGPPSYAVMLIDPQAASTPVSLTSSHLDDVHGWTLDRFLSAYGLAGYFPRDALGQVADRVLLTETGRGSRRGPYEAAINSSNGRQPPIMAFPAGALNLSSLRYFDVLGRGEELLFDQLAALPADELIPLLRGSAGLDQAFCYGDVRAITRRFETIRKLCDLGRLSPDQVASVLKPCTTHYRPTIAIENGRPEALRLYRKGIESCVERGMLVVNAWKPFGSLFDSKATRSMQDGLSSMDPAVAAAAREYAALLDSLRAVMQRPSVGTSNSDKS